MCEGSSTTVGRDREQSSCVASSICDTFVFSRHPRMRQIAEHVGYSRCTVDPEGSIFRSPSSRARIPSSSSYDCGKGITQRHLHASRPSTGLLSALPIAIINAASFQPPLPARCRLHYSSCASTVCQSPQASALEAQMTAELCWLHTPRTARSSESSYRGSPTHAERPQHL